MGLARSQVPHSGCSCAISRPGSQLACATDDECPHRRRGGSESGIRPIGYRIDVIPDGAGEGDCFRFGDVDDISHPTVEWEIVGEAGEIGLVRFIELYQHGRNRRRR